ncbi:MAG: M3 family oligoendopeptidase [Clostridia bacterium]|nr:M3 family oligoendopeptidase [Clostridia bacterium]MBR2613640.1 M3 family oligoendopeptidase [Clostridia bacterium]
MYNEWSLDIFYKGIDDPALEADVKKLEDNIALYKSTIASLTPDYPARSLRAIIDIKENTTVLVRKIAGYCSLRRSANSKDSEVSALMTRIQMLLAGTAKENVAFEKYVGAIEDLDAVLDSDEVLAQYKFYFSEVKASVSHNLSDEAEDVFARLNISGGRAWGDLFSYLTATVEVDYKGEVTTLSAIRGLAESDDKETRKSAYEAEIAAYKKIKDPIAFALNSIKAQVNTEAELRGYENPLAMTLEHSRMKKETLDAMLEAMREYMPKFRKYLRHKAELLGYENGLPWYEIFAPMGKAGGKTFTAEESHAYLVEHFESFAPDLAEMVDEAFKNDWIDFYPRAGKVGGAFCSNLPFLKQSRVLTNFSGSFGSIVTLAHELGHAYHGLMIQDHRPLNTGYTMPVAETASNFNELIIVNDAIAKSEGEEKIQLIESQLQDCTQIIVDIYSRFLFEDEVIRRRKNTFLFAKDLEEIMINAQKEAYGDGLDPDTLHPYMWCCKSHYFSAGLSYYNFPYAFGGLFSRGLYAKYLEEGESFLPKYRALLKATTVESVENVAHIAGIDLTNPDFWRKSLDVIAEKIDEFIAETSK